MLSCDPNCVLSVLQKPCCEAIRDIPSCNMGFLVAIVSARWVYDLVTLSCKKYFTILHNNKVLMLPRPSFLLKLVSAFNLSEDIILPSLCPALKHPKEISIHCLDVVRAIRVYLKATAPIRQTDYVCPIFWTSQGTPCFKVHHMIVTAYHQISGSFLGISLPSLCSSVV